MFQKTLSEYNKLNLKVVFKTTEKENSETSNHINQPELPMKKNSTQTPQPMATTTINRRPVARGPKNEILHNLRQFARAYYPLRGTSLPGIVLN